jgi:hypothetical protein
VAADGAARLETAHAWHVHVEQHEIEALIAELRERRIAALRVVDLVALSGQCHAHHPSNLGVVVNHENPACAHLSSSDCSAWTPLRMLRTRGVNPERRHR